MSAREPKPRPGLLVRLAVNVPIALVIVVLILYRFGAIQTLRVSSINMVPTLEPADHVVVRAYGREPVLGDVVVYRSPFDPEHLQVGRIVGVSGNRVELTEEGLHLDGQAAAVPVPADCGDGACEAAGKEEPASCSVAAAAVENETDCADAGGLVGAEAIGDRRFFTRRAGGVGALLFAPVTVPDEHFFVLSDNRVDERDSRIYGAIPHHAVVGVLSFVYYAADERGIRWERITRRVS
jgi:signal peptidase I